MSSRSGIPATDEGELAVQTLVVYADKVSIEKKEEEKPPARHALVNSILFAALMVLVTIWFSVHLSTFLTQTVILGTVTIWTLIQVVIGRMKDAVGDRGPKWWRAVVGHPSMTAVLEVALSAALLLFLLTSSIYVKLGDSKAMVHITVSEDGTALKDVRLGLARKVGGGPLLSGMFERRLVLHVERPRGYQDQIVSLKAGQALDLAFPEQFPKRAIVRIFAPYRFSDSILSETADRFGDASLAITARERTVTVRPFVFGTAYVGASDRAVTGDLIGQSLAPFEEERRREILYELLAEDTAVPRIDQGAIIDRYLMLWRRDPNVRSEWDLVEGDVVSAAYQISGQTVLSCLAVVSESKVNDCVLTLAEAQ